MAAGSFTHLHLHSQYSFSLGAIRLGDLFSAVNDYQMDAVALTDHGNICGAIDFYTRAHKAGVKPILGADLYVDPNGRFEKPFTSNKQPLLGQTDEEAKAHIYQLVVLAKNKKGYRNLCELLTKAYLEGFHYRPRVDRELLEKHREGLVVLSGSLAGEVSNHFLAEKDQEALEAIQWYRETFRDDYYLEMQPAVDPRHRELNEKLVEQGEKLGIPLVGTGNCYYLNPEDSESHDALLCIQSGKTLESDRRFRLPPGEHWFKPTDLMEEAFAFHPEALSNTREIVNKCGLELTWTDEKGNTIYLLPEYPTPYEDEAKEEARRFLGIDSEGEEAAPPEKVQRMDIEEAELEEAALEGSRSRTRITLDDHLRNCSREGLEYRFGEPMFNHLRERDDWESVKKTYRDRLERELETIIQTGFAGYFLIVADFIVWSKKRGIPVGPGRGSGAGSLVAYALRITNIDPIEFDLLFERFINPERISLPDFDVDFCQERRGEVIDYVTARYGKEKVCQIVSYGALTAKAVLKDVCRVHDMSFKEANELTALVPAKPGMTLEKAFAQEPELGELEESDPRYQKIFKISRSLEGLYRQPGMHAAGVIITDNAITNYAPLLLGKDGAPTVQYDKDFSETIGLVKFDFLGLKTLDVIDKAVQLVQRKAPDFNIEAIDYGDVSVYEMISKGDTLGVFQIESDGMRSLCLRLKPSCIEDIIALVALYRPGPLGSGMVDDFIDRKHGRTDIVYDLPQLESILKETYGVILYQEQVMQIARTLADYTLGQADILRRAMGKKKIDEMARQRNIFIEGALKNEIPQAKAEKVFDLMASFAEYGFNKSHSAAYAWLTFQTAYLKKYYTSEFMAALLSTEMGDTDKVALYIKDTKEHEISILPPDVNESAKDFNVPLTQSSDESSEEKRIRFGFGAVKGLGDAAIEAILDERKEGPFEGFIDFVSRVPLRKINRKTLESLIKAGAFDQVEPGQHRANLLGSVEKALAFASKEQEDRALGQGSLFGAIQEESVASQFEFEECEELDEIEKLRMEKELVGFYVSGHPLDNYMPFVRRLSPMDILTVVQKAKSAGNGLPDQLELAGVVSEVKPLTTKKGDRMAVITLEDLTGELEMVVFPRVYQKSAEFLQPNQLLRTSGQIETEGDRVKFFPKSIGPLQDLDKEEIKGVHFSLPLELMNDDALEGLRKVMRAHPGSCPSRIVFHTKDGQYACLKLSEDWGVSPSTELVGKFNRLFDQPGQAMVEFQ